MTTLAALLRRTCLALLLATAGTSVWATPAPQVSEATLKAAFLYNFTLFVEWPAGAPSSGPFVVGVLGDENVANALVEVTRTKSVAGRPIEVRRLASADDPRDCHMIYIGAAGDRQSGLLRRTRSLPVLTVGETGDFLHDGGIVRFVVDRKQLRFQLNPAAADESGLKLSVRLRKLAVP